jgi:signal transduction histidine kinase
LFYETQWFYPVLALSLGIASTLLWRWRVTQIKQRFASVLAERARVARELHDTLLQSLVGLGLHLDTLSEHVLGSSETGPLEVAGELRRLRKHIERYAVEARESIWDLRTPQPDTVNLVQAITDEAQTITRNSSIRVDVTYDGEQPSCSAEVRRQLLRLVREALTNAIRHANPAHIAAHLIYGKSLITLQIRDDGAGFVPSHETRSGDLHWGLQIMHERAQRMGGRLTVNSVLGQGTTIEVTIPCLAGDR